MQPEPAPNHVENGFDLSKLTLVTLHMGHHAARSGYDRLIDYFPNANCMHTGADQTYAKRIASRLLNHLVRQSGSLWYQRANLITEMTAAAKWMVSSQQVFHFLYGENSYRYLGHMKRLRKKNHSLIATFHTPTWRMEEVVENKDHLRHLDRVVVMTGTQKDYFADIIGQANVDVIKHGVDTEYYVPSAKDRESGPLKLISVGRHLRDFDLLEQTAKVLAAKKADVELIIVSQPKWLERFANYENTRLCADVSDSILLRLYQEADALFLPLLDATANNALLEGMACGLPVISTDLPGVRDYISADSSLLTEKGDIEGLLASISRVYDDSQYAKQLGVLSRESALQLDWQTIANQTIGAYQLAHARS